MAAEEALSMRASSTASVLDKSERKKGTTIAVVVNFMVCSATAFGVSVDGI
jgi:hypothetical protein